MNKPLSAAGLNRLDLAQIRRVKILLGRGLQQQDVAKRFNVSQTTISKIARGDKVGEQIS